MFIVRAHIKAEDPSLKVHLNIALILDFSKEILSLSTSSVLIPLGVKS